VNAVVGAERVRAVLAEYGALVRVVIQDPWNTGLINEANFAAAAQCEQLVVALGAEVAAADRDRGASRVDELRAELSAERDALVRKVDEATLALGRVNAWWRDAQAERDEARAEVEALPTEVDALTGDREALARIVAAAADVEAWFDAGLVSAQGAFERLLAAVRGAR
jgi:chromosome segregation ATPase